MVKKKTHEEFIREIEGKFGKDIFEVLEIYKNNKTKIKVRHLVCDEILDVFPNSLLKSTSTGCKKCSSKIENNKKTKTKNEFSQEVYDLVGDEYSILSEYNGSTKLIKFKHNTCGYEYETKAYIFTNNGSRCPKCAGRIRKTHDYFVEEVNELGNRKYQIIGNYKGAEKRVEIEHLACGYRWFIFPSSFLQGSRCPKCSAKEISLRFRSDPKEFKEKFYKLSNDEYELLDEYIDTKTHVKIKHLICSTEYNVIPSNFLQGTRCPICSQSKGENEISKWLNKNNIKYEPQFKFEDCKNKKILPFDFAIFIDDNKTNILCLVEYDGIQHFESVDFAGKGKEWSKEKFKNQQFKDKIKTDYCKKNNIPLIRIPYWDFENIEYELETSLSQLFIENQKNIR